MKMLRKKTDHNPVKYMDLVKIFAGRDYISIAALEKIFETRGGARKTLLCYLVEWKKQKKIFSAGRGWYSNLEQPLTLDSTGIEKYVSFLKQSFPLLEFKCWSTRQLTIFHQHHPLRYTTFIYVDRYSMADAAEALKEQMPDEPVFVHPSLKSGGSLSCGGDRIIIRPLLYDDRQTPESFFLRTEELLVEYAVESERLKLIDSTEFRIVFENMLRAGRINISALLRRIAHRNTENPNLNMIMRRLT